MNLYYIHVLFVFFYCVGYINEICKTKFILVILFCKFHGFIFLSIKIIKSMSGSFTGAVVIEMVTVMCKGKFN